MSKETTSPKSKKSYELPFYITKTMRALEFVHPKLALEFALKLFFTPLKFPIPKREKPLREKAKLHEMHTGKSPFKVFEWGKGEKKAVLMHGWSGRATQFFKIAEALLKENYHVYSVEAPAHGGSEHGRTHMLEFVDALDIVIDKFGPFPLAIGHSLGGMVIFNALKNGFDPKTVVTIGTPANIRNVVYDFCHKVEAGPKVAEGIINYIEKRYSMSIEDFSTDQLALKNNPQGMIIHDLEDLDVDVTNAYELKEKWPNAHLVITEGLGHRKVLMDLQIIESIIGFHPVD